MRVKWTDWKGVKAAGYYWWHDGDMDSGLVIVSVLYSGTGKNYFVSEGNVGFFVAKNVENLGGFWHHIKEPNLPIF